MSDATHHRIAENPFHILGLHPDCSRADVEREGQKLLGMLALDLTSAKSFATPLGPQRRTADLLRYAMAELRDPERRLLHELWAHLPARPVDKPAATPASSATPTTSAPWPEARVVFGWRSR